MKESENDTGYRAKGGVLLKCDPDRTTITIGDDIEAVAANAFDGCENLKINRSEKYIQEELEERIVRSMKSIEYDFRKSEGRLMEFNKTYPVLRVYNMDSDSMDKAIHHAIDAKKDEDAANEWKLTTIDADDILKICGEIDYKGRDNLVTMAEDSIKSLRDIPFLISWPVNQLGEAGALINDMISKEGFGVLYIKNITTENNASFPRNFIYNLVKSHSFYNVRLSPKWLIVLEVGDRVRLDAPGDIGRFFIANDYKNIPVERYLKHMEWSDRLINVEDAIVKMWKQIKTKQHG